MIHEYASNDAIVTPEGVFIIGTYDGNGVPNAMNAAWGQQSDYGQITLFLGHHKTTENIEKTHAFTVAFATVDTLVVSDYFGMETGSRVNKIEKAGVCVHRAPHVNAPVFECYPVTLECSLVSWDEESGFLTGKIECMLADESVLTDGKVDLDKLKPILFDSTSGSYRSFGPIVGKAFHDGLVLKK